MKFACLASTLALLPASLAFAPGSSKTHLQRESALNGFLSDVFADRISDSGLIQKKRMVERFGNSLKKGVTGDFKTPTRDEEETYYKNKSVGNFDYIPTEEMTGVEPYYTRLCATLSSQVYDIQDGIRDSFLLNTKERDAETLILDKHGVFQPTSPTFGAVVAGDKLILVWRGTDQKAPMDVINDVALSPCSSVVWRKHAKTIRMQGAMASLCLNDIATYEEEVIAACKKHDIKEIITTG